MRTLMWFILSVTLLSCGQKFGDESNNDDTIKSNSNEPVEISVIEGNEIGEYRVQFLSENGKAFSIIKHDLLNDEILEIAVNVSDEFIDEDVVSGQTYKYEVGEYAEDKSFNHFVEKEVIIPLDLNIRSEEKFDLNQLNSTKTSEGYSLIEIKRIQLGVGSTMYSQGHPIYLKVEKLISRGGIVKTFEEDSKADLGNKGKEGGTLFIEAKYAKGDLAVFLNGQNGGDGIRPAPLGLEGKGKNSTKKGSDGSSEAFYEQPLFSKEIFISDSCNKSPGQGGRGGQGKKGKTGGTGGDGGSSGRASIIIKEPNSFIVSYKFTPGKGGKGSIGGAGGPGGDGGPSGGEHYTEIIEDEDCQCEIIRKKYYKLPEICSSNHGPDGLKGPNGDNGKSGTNGAIEVFCIKLGSESETKCFKENK